MTALSVIGALGAQQVGRTAVTVLYYAALALGSLWLLLIAVIFACLALGWLADRSVPLGCIRVRPEVGDDMDPRFVRGITPELRDAIIEREHRA
jgi:hypothetical protein